MIALWITYRLTYVWHTFPRLSILIALLTTFGFFCRNLSFLVFSVLHHLASSDIRSDELEGEEAAFFCTFLQFIQSWFLVTLFAAS